MYNWVDIRLEADAINAEIQGMIAANQERVINGEALAYSEYCFTEKALALRNLADMYRERVSKQLKATIREHF